MVDQKAPELIITGSFNGLLERIGKIDFFDVWLAGCKIPRKERAKATMRVSEVSELTGLTREDVELFASLRLISVVEAAEDPMLSFKEVYCLVKIFERIVEEGDLWKSSPTRRESV